MLNDKSILITGGTGSLGKELTKTILAKWPELRRLIIYSRDEQKQFQMAQEYPVQKYPMIPALKSTIATIAQDDSWHSVRPPLTALSAELRSELKSDLVRQGFEMPNLIESVH